MFVEKAKLVFYCTVVFILSGCSISETGTAHTPSNTTQEMARPRDGMQMVFVAGGSFTLSEQDKGNAGSHSVTLDSYWIDQTEVTNEQYSLCVEDGSCRAPTVCAWGDPTYEDESYKDHPVICVTRAMAIAYCDWVGGRLPTEAEWDFAARGPVRTVYPWGNGFDPARLNFCDASCAHTDAQYHGYNDGYAKTSPAGSYPEGASWCSTLDMAGNVWEWVSDWYGPYTREDQINPTGPGSGIEGVIRGGSWYDTPDFNRSDHRHPYDPQDHNHLIGFRCVMPYTEVDQGS